MVTTNPVTQTDNINNFTAAGKAAAKTEADKAGDQLFSNYQDFIKLLTTQLQNQDPTKPMETDQITSQLAQLSTVEQGVNTNKNLEKLLAAFGQSQSSQSVSYIGKFVEAPGNTGELQNGAANFVYNLDSEAKSVDVTISDAGGNVVYNGAGATAPGRNVLTWDGSNNDGAKVADGTYTITVKAKDAAGANINATTSATGIVSSVEAQDGTTYLVMGDSKIALSKVSSVTDVGTNPTLSSQAVSYIGKLVEAPGNLGALVGGKGAFVYTLASGASKVNVTISDSKGTAIYKTTGTTLAGRNTFLWDGTTDSGTMATDGTYKITVSAVDTNGNAIQSGTSTAGKVTSVEMMSGNSYLALGDILVPLGSVISVRDMPTAS